MSRIEENLLFFFFFFFFYFRCMSVFEPLISRRRFSVAEIEVL